MPELGYERALGDLETRALIADRRARDIIAAHAGDDKSAAVITDEPIARRGGSPKSDMNLRRSDIKTVAAAKPFVDRQLELAMKYLRDELAKK